MGNKLGCGGGETPPPPPLSAGARPRWVHRSVKFVGLRTFRVDVDGSFVTSSNNMGGGTVSCCMAIYEVWGISWVVERVISQVNFI